MPSPASSPLSPNLPTALSPRPPRRRRFVPHPLVAAICAALAGPVLALPQGGQVVAGQATISTPTPTTQVINQTSQRAIIDWTSFSIAAGERVRFNQPSTTAVTLNRVVGYDPSYILGQMSSNGRVFLVNPYGVVFGAGARVDVGGLVVSTLSIANGDFMAGRYTLTADDGVAAAARGAIRNDGEIRAGGSSGGGTVAFVAPRIVNTGSIEAHGGRVALVATGGARVDLDGDGLVVFDARASEATARLEQLGRVAADGGSIELRAQARAALADTVLNVDGVTRARSIGTREGRIVIDGGATGAVTVGGQIDAGGLAAGERGGRISVEGRDITLAGTARLDASGAAGGGAIFVGGGARGADATLRNATTTTIADGATLSADATGAGNGGTVVAWADDTTRFTGRISVRGGEQGGDGGWAEVSGRQGLLYAGYTDARAPSGLTGTLLLDPLNVTVSSAADSTTNFNTTTLQTTLGGANVVISTDIGGAQPGTITVTDPVQWSSTNSLTLRADAGITIGSTITATSGGSLFLFAGGGIALNAAVALNGGNFRVAATNGTDPAPSFFTASAAGTISTAGPTGAAGGSVEIRADGNIATSTITTNAGTSSGAGLAGGAVTLVSTAGTVSTTGAISARGGAAGGSNQNGGAGGAVTIGSPAGLATVGAGIASAGGAPTGTGTAGGGGAVAITGTGVTVASAATVDAGSGTITIDGNAGAIALGTSSLLTSSTAAGAITVHDASTVALGSLSTGTGGGVTLGVAGDITGAVTQAGTIGAGTLTASTAGAVTLGGANALTGLGAVATGGGFTLNNAGALTVNGAVSAGGLAQIGTTAGALTVAAGASVGGNGVTLAAGGAGNALDLQGAVSGGAGTVTLNAGGAITQTAVGTVSTSGTLTIAAGGAITLDQGNAIGALGNVSRGGAFTLNDTGGGLDVTGNVTGGSTANAVSITTAGGALALSGNVTTTTGAGTLALTGVGVTQSGGTVLAGGNATIDAGTGAIGLLSATNDFGGNVSLAATGAAAVRDANALVITSATGNGLTAIAGTTLTVPAASITTTGGDVDLRALGGTLSTPGAISTAGGAITLVGANGLTVANNLSSGGGNIQIAGGGAGGLAVSTGVAVDAGSGSIVARAGGGAIDLAQSTLASSNTGAAVTVRDASTVALGNIDAGAGTVTLGVGADVTGAVTQNAGTTLTASTLTASTAAAITLGTVGTLTIDNLGSVRRGGALTIVDSAGGLAVTGNIDQGSTGNSVSLSTTGGALALGDAAITVTGAGTLSLTGTGVTQTAGGSLQVAGTTTVTAGSGNIALAAAANDFTGAVALSSGGSSVAIRDANALTLGSLTLSGGADVTAIAGSTLALPGSLVTTGDIDLRSTGGSLSVGNALSGRDVSLTGSSGIALGANITAGRDLTLTTTNAAVTQSAGVLQVADHTNLATGTGSVALTQANTLTRLGGTAGTVNVTTSGGLVLDPLTASALTLTAGGTVSQAGAANISGATTVNAAGQTVSLTDAGNALGSVGGTAATLSVTDGGGVALGTTTVTTLNVDTSGGNGAITQTGTVSATGADLNAGSGSITLLTASNDFGTVALRGGNVQLRDTNAIVLAAGTMADLTLTAGGTVTQSGALAVAGSTAVTSPGAVTLNDASNDFGTFGASAAGQAVTVRDSNALVLGATTAGSLSVATNGALTQSGAAVVTGTTVVTTVNGAIALDNTGNDFANAPGNSFSGGAITLRDANALTVTTLAAGVNQNVSVTAGGALTLPAGGISTGTGSLTLASGALLATPGALYGGNISLTGAGGVLIGDDITASGTLALASTNSAITQAAGRIVAGGAATVGAGTGSVSLSGPTNDFASVNVTSASSATLVDQNALGIAGNVTGAFNANAGGALSTIGAVSGNGVTLVGSAGITLAHNVTATGGALTLTASNSAITQTAGAISATTGLTTVNAGSGDVTLAQAGNDFSDGANPGIAVTGGAVRITDANNLRVASLVNLPNHDLALVAGGSITGVSGNIDTGSANLTISAGTGFTTFGTLRGNDVALGGGSGGLSIGHDVTALGNLNLAATNAAIAQTAGRVVVAGTTTASAGTGNVTLNQAANDFGTFAASGGAVSVRDANAIALGTITATTLAVDTSAGNGAVTQSGPATVTGATTITAGTGNVTLGNADNDFSSVAISGGAVSLRDANALVLAGVTASSLAVDTAAGNGNVTQTAPLVVSGAVGVSAGSGNVTLASAGNQLGSFGATGGTVAVTDSGSLALDATSATTLTVNAGGAVTQNGAAVVSGTTTVAAGSNAVTLGNAGNDFGTLVATGGAVSVRDANAIVLGAVTASSLAVDTSAGNGAVTQSGAAVVSGATTVNAGSGAVTLANAGNDFASIGVSGGAVSLRDSNALVLAGVNAASLGVVANGALTQTGAVVVSGATSLAAGTGNVTLTNAGNDFATLGVSGGAINVVDANALVLSGLTSGPNQAVSVSAGGTLTLPAGAIDTGTASLSLTSGGALATAGTLRGNNVALAAAGPMTLGHDVTALGSLSLTTANAPLTQTAGRITAAGPTTVAAGSGAIDLAQAGNDFQSPVSLSGGAISVRDANDLAVASLSNGANQAVSLVAGGSLSLPAAPIDTGTAALTLQALGGSLVVNGPLSGGLVTLTGATGLTLAANVTSVGDQIYTTAVQLAGNVALDAGSSRIDLQGGVLGGGHDLTLASTGAAADAIRTSAAISGVAALAVNGASTLGGNVTTSGAQTFAGRVTLAADVALNAGAARIDLQGGLDGAGHDLALASSLAAPDAVRIGNTLDGVDQLTVNAAATLAATAGSVTTTGAQAWNGAVTLLGNARFAAPSLSFGNGIAAGSANLALATDALSLSGPVSGSGDASIAGLGAGTTLGIAGGSGTLQLAQSTLDRFASFGTLTLGRSDGTGAIQFGNLLLPTRVQVLSASGDVTFGGTVGSVGAARDLSVSTGGTTRFDGAVGGAIGSPQTLASLAVAGASQVDASVNTAGAQSYGGNVAIGQDATLSAGSIAFAGSLDVGTHGATLLTDALTLAGTASGSGTGSLRVAPRDAAGTTGLAGGNGTLQLSQALLDRMGGVPRLVVGRTDGSGAIDARALTLTSDLTISSGSGNVTLASVDSAAGPARDLLVSTGGTTTLAGAIGATGALDTLTITGSSRIGANVTTSGTQRYDGAATLVADATLAGPTVDFGSTLDGAQALTVNAANTRFAAGVGQTTALASLVTDAAGSTTIGGNVTTTGIQTWGDALSIGADLTLRAGVLTLAGTVDGAHALGLNGTQVTLGGPIGTGTALTSLAVVGPLTLGAGSVITTGAQSYAGATTLASDTALQASSVAFASTLDGAHALAVQTSGTTAFGGAVGATTPLASVAVGGGGLVQIGGSGVATSGAQSYAGPVQFAGAAMLSGSALTLSGAASGATDLTLRTDQLSGATALSGSGTLTIAPQSQGTSVGVAGGAGTLQVSQAVLDGASGFTAHVIGRVDGTGTLTTGNLLLRADTTLQTGSGLLDIAGSVDGAHALTLAGGGTTHIGGTLGAGTPLASLTVDNNATAADSTDGGLTGEHTLVDTVDASGRARVFTIGAQNWLDPVIATVPVSFSGGAIVANQTGNRFEQSVAASATSLDLYAASNLHLGDVQLANGGRLQTAGVLHITGALRLDGGTLLLVADGSPTVGDFADPALAGRPLAFGFTPLGENSATIVQETGGTVASAVGSLLVVRATAGGSIALDGTGNTLLGGISAVSGTPGSSDAGRFSGAGPVGLGFVRIASNEIHVVGASPSSPDAALQQAGIEGDAIKLTADVLTTGSDGLIRARLPFNNVQGAQTSVPGITFVMTPEALARGGGFGGPDQNQYIRVRVGGAEGGFITARPNGASGDTAVIFLGGPVEFRPFYDGAGRLTEIRVFYNGDAPRTPQEEGALAAVIALIEDARHARFEEAVRTENVTSRLRSGVIAEVGAGRPATVGRESIKLPEVCDLKPQSLRCEQP